MIVNDYVLFCFVLFCLFVCLLAYLFTNQSKAIEILIFVKEENYLSIQCIIISLLFLYLSLRIDITFKEMILIESTIQSLEFV